MMTGNVRKPCGAVREPFVGAARRLARTYDGALAGSGMNVTQFAVMRALERYMRMNPLSRVADDLAMERTSLVSGLGVAGKK